MLLALLAFASYVMLLALLALIFAASLYFFTASNAMLLGLISLLLCMCPRTTVYVS